MKRFHKVFGTEGEQKALWYLRKKGYVPVTKNFATVRGEIDLVMLDGEELVFVEVKTMTEKARELFGAPAEKVTQKKREHLTRAAQIFLNEHRQLAAERYVRFDVLEVTFYQKSIAFHHIKNAFEAESGFHNKKLF